DLRKLLPLGRQTLDRNLADSADTMGYEPPLHHMMCIASLKNPNAKSASDLQPYLNLFHAGFLIAADERDFAEIFELAGMPCVMVETVERGMCVAFIAGSLAQWRDAVVRGCQREISREARHTFNLIFTEFKNIGLAGAFSVVSKPNQRDQTFLLEYKPN
ncbi:MAG: hypothetical protein ACYTFQ_05875, partial [Planctomycetota bacterium]